MYIKFIVIFPSKLSEERKMYIKKLIQPTDGLTNGSIDSSLNVDNKHYKFLNNLSSNEHVLIETKINGLRNKQPTPDMGEDSAPNCTTQ